MILSEWLKETGRTVDGFAEELGKRRQTIHRYLNGTRHPSRAVIQQIDELSEGKVPPASWYQREHREAAE